MDKKDLHKKDLVKARKLCDDFRFVDDLNEINDAEIFGSNFMDIPERIRVAIKEWQ